MAARHLRRPQPRAHWILLLLGSSVLLAALCFHGYTDQARAEGAGPYPLAAGREPAPPEVRDAGPVLRIDATGQLTSRGMPPGTIALTFDDGPDPEWTPRILDVLARHQAHATFFLTGSKINERPDLVRRILAEGHEIGAHTFTHPELSTVSPWRRWLEMTLTQNAIVGATQHRVTMMRPPFASRPANMSAAEYDAVRSVSAGQMLIVLSDLDTRDWSRPGVDSIVAAATPPPGAGAVVTFHDGGGDRSQTVAAVNVLLDRLADQGYRFTTVSMGLGIPDGDERAGAAAQWRGQALRVVQGVSGWLMDAMTALLIAALVLTTVRLTLQVATAQVHARRARRRSGRRLYDLGPVTVVVPAYNEAANIAATVTSLWESDYPDVEVIVVDDGSTDDTADIVRGLGLSQVRVICQPNAGKPAALNTGISAAGTELLVLADGDTVFDPAAIGRLVQPFLEPDVGAVSGNTKVANRRGLLGRWQHLEYVINLNLDRRMFEIGNCMTTVPGAIGAFRRRALADVGGVSSATLAEDTDVTMSIIRAGWRVVYEETAIAWTEVPSSLGQLWRQRYRWAYGTLQAMWQHRWSIVESGSAGRLGRRGLIYLVLFQVLLPLTAPAMDVYAVYGLFFLPLDQVVVVWLVFLALQLLTAAYALRLDRERLAPLWTLPLQQLVYRQPIYLVLVQSSVTAFIGIRLRWHRMSRTGAASEAFGVR